MSSLDSMYEFLMKAFKVQSKELTAEDAMREAGKLPRFFAVQLNYKGTPVRLIVAASTVPRDLQS